MRSLLIFTLDSEREKKLLRFSFYDKQNRMTETERLFSEKWHKG